MSFILANFLGNSPVNSDQNEDKQLIIEKLTGKMINSSHLEDRKAAAQTIKSLARSHRLEIGTLALQSLIDELRRDFEDEELAKIILETLDILCSSKVGEEGIEVQFCEILLKNEQNITLLLDLMGDSDDFYLKFTSIQILISLCNSQPFQLQLAVLNSHSGVEKVLNLLKDSREIIRNEGLLFCGSLVRGSTDLQKILAFQGAFEQVMKIIVEDENGTWDGQIIIQDAFNLIFELLNLNTANQTYFRDSICFKQLAGLLAIPQDKEEKDCDFLWNRTRISNYLAGLSLLDGILCKSNVDLEASQNAAMKTHFFSPLIQLAFNPKIPQKVSASALNCLSGMIWSNNRTQLEFAKEKLSFPVGIKFVQPPIYPLMAAVCLAVHGNPVAGSVSEEDAVNQRLKALELVESFCVGNPDGQLVLLSTLKSTSDSSASPGSVILEGLFDLDASRKRDPWHCWFASGLLCHLIDGNEDAKHILLKHRMIDSDGDEDEDILTALMLNLIRMARDSPGSTCQKSIIAYLQLILIWFHEAPTPIRHFLQEGSYVQHLIERITQQSYHQDIQIQGISALILGICVLYNDESVANFGSEALKRVIKNRIGPDLFISKLSRLRTETNGLVSGVLMKNYDNLVKLVARPTPAGTKASHTATLAQLTKDLTECRALLTDTQTHLTQSETLTQTLKIGISERDAYILQIQKIISAKNQKIAQMAHEMSNFESQQQQQMTMSQENHYERYLSDQAALQSLNEIIKSFQETVARQQARIEELEALLNANNKSGGGEEGELAKWKEAYHKLYEKVREQLNFNEEFEAVIAEPVVAEQHSITELTKVTDTEQFEPTTTELAEPIVTELVEPAVIESILHIVAEPAAVLPIPFGSSDVVLSPSMFMSPLAEDSSVSILSNDPVIIESTAGSSPELISLNQVPIVDNLTSEYPELKDSTIGTSFTAAVIVSEEYALKDPNPATDEKFMQSISAECPPDSFLDSDPGDLEIVSQEEIRNVLGFFDNLSDEHETKNIQERIDTLELNFNESEVQNVEPETEVIDATSYEPEIVFDNPESSITVDQEYTEEFTAPESYSHDVSEYPSENDYTHDYTVSTSEYTAATQDESVYTESYNVGQEYSTEYDYDQTAEPATEYSQEYNAEYNNQDQQGEYFQEQGAEYNQGQQDYQYCNSEYNQDQQTEYNQEHTTEYDQNQSSEYGQERTTEHNPYQNIEYAQEPQPEYNQEQPAAYIQESNAEHTQEPSSEYYQDPSIEYVQEPSTEYFTEYPQEQHAAYSQDQHAEYPQEQQAHYSQEQQAEYPQEQQAEYNYITSEYPSEYNQEYPSECQYSQSNEQIQSYEQSSDPQIHTASQSYGNDQTSHSYEQVYEQEYTPAIVGEQQKDQQDQQEHQESSEYYYYDESTGFTYGFDQNVNQYYYYDPNTEQYTYYTAAATDTATDDSASAYYTTDATESDTTTIESNPSLFDTAGPPMVSLQHQSSGLVTNNFAADQIYNL